MAPKVSLKGGFQDQVADELGVATFRSVRKGLGEPGAKDPGQGPGFFPPGPSVGIAGLAG